MALKLEKVKKGFDNECYWLMVRLDKKERTIGNVGVKVALMGREGVGKSTLVGVLTKGREDNGKGRARVNVMRY